MKYLKYFENESDDEREELSVIMYDLGEKISNIFKNSLPDDFKCVIHKLHSANYRLVVNNNFSHAVFYIDLYCTDEDPMIEIQMDFIAAENLDYSELGKIKDYLHFLFPISQKAPDNGRLIHINKEDATSIIDELNIDGYNIWKDSKKYNL